MKIHTIKEILRLNKKLEDGSIYVCKGRTGDLKYSVEIAGDQTTGFFFDSDKAILFAKTLKAIRTVPKVEWIINYVGGEGFPDKHMEALCHIIGILNDCEKSEKEILNLADRLYKEYAE